jgi:hypothetical protein
VPSAPVSLADNADIVRRPLSRIYAAKADMAECLLRCSYYPSADMGHECDAAVAKTAMSNFPENALIVYQEADRTNGF